MIVRVAAANWKMRPQRSDAGYFGHLHDFVSLAHDKGADVLVLPELHVLELLSLERNLKEHQSPMYLSQYAKALEVWLLRIADSSGLTIVAGSHFVEVEEGFKNICAIVSPGRPMVKAEKNNLTQYEREIWNVRDGRGLAVVPPRLGVAICYDAEFAGATRSLAEAGAEILAVPSWTETYHGHQRVRWSCLARAVEHQTFVVHASLVGGLGYEPVPDSVGSSAIIAPSVEPFPVQSVLAESPFNEEALIVADLDLAMLEEARLRGEVRNWDDRERGDWTVTDYR
ncbi:carbon-nitrogen hydrolase family protein [soil metagenome]